MAEPRKPDVAVTLTIEEVRALRLASIFGGPDKPHAPLESALRKLRQAEREATTDAA